MVSQWVLWQLPSHTKKAVASPLSTHCSISYTDCSFLVWSMRSRLSTASQRDSPASKGKRKEGRNLFTGDQPLARHSAMYFYIFSHFYPLTIPCRRLLTYFYRLGTVLKEAEWISQGQKLTSGRASTDIHRSGSWASFISTISRYLLNVLIS